MRATWSVTDDSESDTELTITKAAAANQRHYVQGFSVALSGAAAGSDVSIELKDGTTVIWKEIIGKSAAVGTRVAVHFGEPGLECSPASAVSLAVGKAGTDAVTTANMHGYTE